MNRNLSAFGFLFLTNFVSAGVQPIDFTNETVHMVNDRIIELGDPFQNIVRDLRFNIDSSNAMPGASAGWINGIPTIIFTSSLLDVVFYTAELNVLSMADGKWNDCNSVYSSYLRNSYADMMLQKQNHMPVSQLVSPEKFGDSCSGIEAYYPFSGQMKGARDQSVRNSIAFIYLHELSHLYYKHVRFTTEHMNNEERQAANCSMRAQEKDADLLAARKMVKFGWYSSALDVTIWMVMGNIGVLESSRNSHLDHPTALERMTYTLDEVRGAIIESGGQVSREMSEAIDESKALLEKVDKQLGKNDNSDPEVVQCDN